MGEQSYEGLDEALVPLHQYLQMLMPPEFEATGPESSKGMRIRELELSMPVEIDIVTGEDGRASVGLSPPLYYVETGFGTTRHQARVTIVEERRLLPRET
jgi:hypothetical protein